MAVRQNNSWTGQQGEEKSGDKKMGKKRKGSNIPEVFEAWGYLSCWATLSDLLFVSLEHRKNIERDPTRYFAIISLAS